MTAFSQTLRGHLFSTFAVRYINYYSWITNLTYNNYVYLSIYYDIEYGIVLLALGVKIKPVRVSVSVRDRKSGA